MLLEVCCEETSFLFSVIVGLEPTRFEFADQFFYLKVFAVRKQVLFASLHSAELFGKQLIPGGLEPHHFRRERAMS